MVSSRGAQAQEAKEALPEDGVYEEQEWDDDELDTSDSAEFFASEEDSDDAEDQVMTSYELGQELGRLKGIWEEPRSTADMAVGEWLPEHCFILIKHHRGSQLQKMGFMCRGRKYLTLEEAIYLVDRGSMTLVTASETSSSVFSRQECYQLLEDSGLHMDAFVAYCHLQRAGHVVRRYPCLLKHNEGRLVDVHKVWQHCWRDSARVCQAQNVTFDTHPHPEAPVATKEEKSKSGGMSHPDVASFAHLDRSKLPQEPTCLPMLAIVAGETECGQKGDLEILAQVVVGQTLGGTLDVQLQQAPATSCKLLFACCLGGDVVFIERRKQSIPVLWQKAA